MRLCWGVPAGTAAAGGRGVWLLKAHCSTWYGARPSTELPSGTYLGPALGGIQRGVGNQQKM